MLSGFCWPKVSPRFLLIEITDVQASYIAYVQIAPLVQGLL